MSISDNILAAFVSGVSTKQEDKLDLNEISENEAFSDLLDVIEEIDAIEGLDELRNEFCEYNDEEQEFNDININIK